MKPTAAALFLALALLSACNRNEKAAPAARSEQAATEVANAAAPEAADE